MNKVKQLVSRNSHIPVRVQTTSWLSLVHRIIHNAQTWSGYRHPFTSRIFCHKNWPIQESTSNTLILWNPLQDREWQILLQNEADYNLWNNKFYGEISDTITGNGFLYIFLIHLVHTLSVSMTYCIANIRRYPIKRPSLALSFGNCTSPSHIPSRPQVNVT